MHAHKEEVSYVALYLLVMMGTYDVLFLRGLCGLMSCEFRQSVTVASDGRCQEERRFGARDKFVSNESKKYFYVEM